MQRTGRASFAASAFRLLSRAGAFGFFLTVSASGQDATDLDLKPADFVPEQPIAIRVDDMKPGKQGSDVFLTVLNRTKQPVDAVVECTLYDADREDLGVVTGQAIRVEAGQRKATTVTGGEAAQYAECQVRGIE